MLFRLNEIKVHCLAMPCAPSVQPELASHSAPFIIIFLCMCVRVCVAAWEPEQGVGVCVHKTNRECNNPGA